MPKAPLLGIDASSPPFDRFQGIHWLAPARSGHHTPDHARHQLYVARWKHNPVSVLIKVTSKPGLVYEQDLANETSSLLTINQALPDSPYFPTVEDHGWLTDGRRYLIMSLFDELPLAAALGPEPVPGKLVTYLRATLEIGRALIDIHRLDIFHVDLNPMNILHRERHEGPAIRIVDFESSYERARHGKGEFYSPPTTPGYSAPEVSRQPPDARADLFSLGAVLYTTVAGDGWTDQGDVGTRIAANPDIDAELKEALLAAVDPDPDNRYPSVQEFRTALATYLERIWPGRTWRRP